MVNARMLWFLSELARHRPDDAEVVAAAHRQRADVDRLFRDGDHGGYLWEVAADGRPTRDRKQVYGQAFATYALASYARTFADDRALADALSLAELIERHAWEPEHGGYLEAFARDWSPIEDQRLSEKDLNAPKTMNTHLHVLEAYTELHRAAGLEATRGMLTRALSVFLERFAEPRGDGHLALFCTVDWHELNADVSFGHDIEASWLVHEAAEVLGDATFLSRAAVLAGDVAAATLREGMSERGGVLYERHAGANGRVPEHHWWVQAEAMVGFWNAYEVTGDGRYADAARSVWSFTTAEIAREDGAWTWLAGGDEPRRGPYLAGFWKGPYHDGRALMEMSRRMSSED